MLENKEKDNSKQEDEQQDYLPINGELVASDVTYPGWLEDLDKFASDDVKKILGNFFIIANIQRKNNPTDEQRSLLLRWIDVKDTTIRKDRAKIIKENLIFPNDTYEAFKKFFLNTYPSGSLCSSELAAIYHKLLKKNLLVNDDQRLFCQQLHNWNYLLKGRRIINHDTLKRYFGGSTQKNHRPGIEDKIDQFQS